MSSSAAWVKTKIAARVATVGVHCLWENTFPGTAQTARDVAFSGRLPATIPPLGT